MSITALSRRCRSLNHMYLNVRWLASSGEVKPIDTEDTHLEPVPANHLSEDDIENIRNKSNLKSKHYNKFHKKPPTLSEEEEQVFPLTYLRSMYGRYGAASGINVGLLWPSKEELEHQKEWERVAYPDHIHKMIEMEKNKKEEEEKKIMERQNEISLKMTKLEDWKQELRQRIAVQEKAALAAKEKKQRLLEEVRRMLGVRVDFKDARYLKALEQKELEEKKAAKAAKKLKKQQKLLEDIQRLKEKAVAKEEDGKADPKLHDTNVVSGDQPPSEPK